MNGEAGSTRYGDIVGPYAGQLVRALREGFAAADRGVKVKPSWTSDGLDGAQLRQWFRDKLDGVINLKAGLRSDGASRRSKLRCRCMGCRHEHMMERGVHEALRYAAIRCHACPPDHAEWGGRRWGDIYQVDLHRDQWRLRDLRERRVRVRRFATDLVRARFGHLEDSDNY